MTRPIALVTGASRGIGRAIALQLATEYSIVATARSTGDLQSLQEEIERSGGECRVVPVDLARSTEVEESLGGLVADVLINNAGVGFLKPFLETTPEEWHRTVDINLNALYHVTRAVLPGMVDRGRGHVLIIGSIAGRSAFVGGTCYGATKHAVMGFAESLMLEVRAHGVRVSVVNPGSVATEFGDGSFREKNWALTPEDVARSVAHVLATPPEVLIHRLEVRASNPKKG
jgi:3-hydroxy acid dehydrogenase / malonic semialdehyde reductase